MNIFFLVSHSSSHRQNHLGVLIETAILRVPMFLFENGKMLEAVMFYR